MNATAENAVATETTTEENPLRAQFTSVFKHEYKARMPVEGSDKKKTKVLANFDIPYPTLFEAFTHVGAIDFDNDDIWQKDGDGNVIMSDGVPQIVDKVAQWLQDSIIDSVLGDAKSIIRLDKDENGNLTGKVNLAPGRAFSVNWEDLLTERARGRDPVKRLHKELLKIFAEWLVELKKTSKTTQFVIGLFANPDVLPLQPQDRRSKFLENYLAPFINSLSDEDVMNYQSAIALIETAANADVDALTGEDF